MIENETTDIGKSNKSRENKYQTKQNKNPLRHIIFKLQSPKKDKILQKSRGKNISMEEQR